ncbi:MAG: oligosaccharide flippase family protein [Hyphomicrobiales bacterium]
MWIREHFINEKAQSSSNKALEMTVLGLIAFAVTYVFNVVVARLMPIEEYGDFSVMFKVLWVVLPFFMLGTNFSMIKIFPLYIDKDNSHAKGFYKWNIKLIVISSIISFALGIGVVITMYLLAEDKSMLDSIIHPCVYALFILPFFMVVFFQRQTLTAIGKLRYAFFHNEITLYVIIVLTMVFIALFVDQFSFYYSIIAIVLGGVVITFFQGLYLPKQLPRNFKSIAPKYDTIKWRNTSFKMLLSGVVGYFLSAFDLLFIEILCPEEADVGMFSSILAIAGIFWVVEGATNQIVTPSISKSFKDGKIIDLSFKKKLNKMLWTRLAITSVFMLAILFFGHRILALFGDEYVEGRAGLIIVSFFLFLSLTHRMANKILLYGGYESLLTKIFLSGLILNAILNFILIPPLHLVGVSISFGFTILYISAISIYFVRKKLNFRTFWL